MDAMAATSPSSQQSPLAARLARPLQPSQADNASDRIMLSSSADRTADQSQMTPSSKLKRLSLSSTPVSTATPRFQTALGDVRSRISRDAFEGRPPVSGLAPAFVLDEPGPSRHYESRRESDSGSFTPRSSAQVKHGPSTDEDKDEVSDDVLATPRDLRSPIRSVRRKGFRSSILYSPAPRDLVSARRDSVTGMSLRDAEQAAVASVDQENGGGKPPGTQAVPSGKDEGEEDARRRKGLTLTERHADLLTAIAHKERRVNELKQELAAQEAALAQLKSKWTSVVSRSTRRPHTTQIPSSSSSLPTLRVKDDLRSSQFSRSSVSSTTASDLAAARPTLLSPSSSASSRLSLDPVRDDLHGESTSVPGDGASGDTTWTSMLTQAIGPEGLLLNQQALIEGKRFWGKFVETVSAAAGGTVPLDVVAPRTEAVAAATELSHGASKLDLTSLRGMMGIPSWSSSSGEASTAAPAPPKPSNSARLAGRRRPQVTSVPAPPRPKTSESEPPSVPPEDRGPPDRSPDQRQPSSRFRDLLDGMSDSSEQPTPVKPMTPAKAALQRSDFTETASTANRDKDEQSADEDGWGW